MSESNESENDGDYVPKLVDRAGSEDDELCIPGLEVPAAKKRKKAKARVRGKGGMYYCEGAHTTVSHISHLEGN